MRSFPEVGESCDCLEQRESLRIGATLLGSTDVFRREEKKLPVHHRCRKQIPRGSAYRDERDTGRVHDKLYHKAVNAFLELSIMRNQKSASVDA